MIGIKARRINGLWMALLATSLLAGSVMLYSILLQSVMGPITPRDLFTTTLDESNESRVALLRSDYTRQMHQFLNSGGPSVTWMDMTVQYWGQYLQDQRIPYDEVRDAALEDGLPTQYSTLILPSAQVLSDRQIEQVKAFMERGGNVLATWAPGIFRPDGSWRGWTFIEDAFGVRFTGFAEPSTSGYQMYEATFPGYIQPGLYVPPAYGDSAAASSVPGDFAPLRGYQRIDSLGGGLPRSDYVEARAHERMVRAEDGSASLQDAVTVTYYTWVGRSPEHQVPYPVTSTNVRRFTLIGNTPLTASISAGYRAKVEIYNPGVLMQVIEPRTKAAGFWYDMATEDRPVAEAVGSTTGLVYGTYGAGRFVYMGFPRDAMGQDENDGEDVAVRYQLYENIFTYLRRKPIAWMREWPDAHTAAATVMGVGEVDLEQLRWAAAILDAHEVPGTFYVQPEHASSFPNLFKGLNPRHEIAMLGVGLFSAHERSLKQIAASKALLETTTGRNVTGFRVPEQGRYSQSLQESLSQEGILYFAPDSIGRRMGPDMATSPAGSLVQMGITARSDRTIFESLHPDSMHLSTAFFAEDISRVQYEGGHYRLVFNADLLIHPDRRDVLGTVAKTLREGDFWLATADSVARWWHVKQGIYVDIRELTGSRLVFRISNTRSQAADRLHVTIDLGRQVPSITLQPELVHTPLPTYRLEEGTTYLHLVVQNLRGKENRVFNIDLPRAEPRLAAVQNK